MTPGTTHARSRGCFRLAQHGDGIADIAMYATDVPAVVARAVTAGLPVLTRARPGTTGCISAVVGGIGSLRHTLVDLGDRPGPIAPPEIPWVRIGRPTSRGRSRSRSRLRQVDHIALCLPCGSLQRVADLYQEVFELREYSRERIHLGPAGMDSRVLRDASGTITYVLAEPTADSRDGQLERFLTEHDGAGVHHLAFSTPAITEAIRAFTARGVKICHSTPALYYDRLARRIPGLRPWLPDLRETGVLVAQEEGGGLLWQIFTRSPHQNRIGAPGPGFYELIERDNGAEGFASENIRELFRANQTAGPAAETGRAG